jgi:hypothetical protein
MCDLSKSICAWQQPGRTVAKDMFTHAVLDQFLCKIFVFVTEKSQEVTVVLPDGKTSVMCHL